MSREEVRTWFYGMHMWAVLFVIILLRVSPLANAVGLYTSPESTLITALAVWCTGGFFSCAFLCRARGLNELDDLNQQQLRLRIIFSIPMGMVALIHSIYQIRQRDMLIR